MTTDSSPKPFEVVKTNTLEVHCEGAGGVLGHPRVFLHIDRDAGNVTCPYCSRQFVYTPSSQHAA